MMVLHEVRFAVRSLLRVKGCLVTVVLTLALGIGAIAAIFSVIRGVLLKPLAHRDEQRVIYVRQSALGIGSENAAFSVPRSRICASA
jgi:putative ABC transport system permease protein